MQCHEAGVIPSPQATNFGAFKLISDSAEMLRSSACHLHAVAVLSARADEQDFGRQAIPEFSPQEARKDVKRMSIQ
jgi:hypothetical protein